MTIATTTTEIVYGGNGVTTSFNFSFVADQPSDIQVVLIAVGGAESILSPSQYSIAVNAIPVGQLWGIGGTVTYPLGGSPLASGNSLKIERILPLTQTISIANQGAFYPQAVEQALDVLQMQIQQVNTGLNYALRAPLTDASPPTAIPTATLRANKYLGFDSLGNPQALTATTGFPIDISGYTVIANGAITPLSLAVRFGKQLTLEDFGAVGDGVTDDGPAINSALTELAATRGTIFLGPKTYAIDSTKGYAFSIPNGVLFQGCGMFSSIFKVINSTEVSPLFTATNPNDVWFADLQIKGNSTAALSASSSGCIYFHMNTSSTANCYNYGLRRCCITNFKQAYWIYNYCEGGTSVFSNNGFYVEDCVFLSLSGNINGSSSASYPSTMIANRGNWSSSTTVGLAKNIHISGCYADGTHVKRFSDMWSCVQDSWQDNNYLYNFAADASNDSGGYACLVYDDSGASGGGINQRPTNIWINNPAIITPRTCGVYCATGVNVNVTNAFVTGQYDTTVPGLVYGAIVYNHTSGVITNPRLAECWRGIGTISPDNGDIKVLKGQITSTVASATGLFAEAAESAAAGFFRYLEIDTDIQLTGSGSTGIKLAGVSGAELGTVKLGGTIGATGNDIYMDNASAGSFVATAVDMEDLVLNGAITSRALYAPGTTSCVLNFRNVIMDGTNFSGNPDGIVVSGATAITVDGLSLRNFTAGSGHAWVAASSATGTLRNVEFLNVSSSRRVASSSLGLAKPTNSADQGAFVQNLSPGVGLAVAWENLDGSTTWAATSYPNTPVNVSALPVSPETGATAFVNNSNAASFTAGIGATVSGGGTTFCPVVYDGTNWRIG